MCKYSIYNDNRFIHLPLKKKEFKYLIYNNNGFIYLLLER